ncbi:MAG TPA: hypothetical protein DEH78_33310 [Solibacterales bacterium]|nr:hypothetical protein [Bryobacterales bacterium]
MDLQPFLGVVGLMFTAVSAMRAHEAAKASTDAAKNGAEMRAAIAEMELRLNRTLITDYMTAAMCRQFRAMNRCGGVLVDVKDPQS